MPKIIMAAVKRLLRQSGRRDSSLAQLFYRANDRSIKPCDTDESWPSAQVPSRDREIEKGAKVPSLRHFAAGCFAGSTTGAAFAPMAAACSP